MAYFIPGAEPITPGEGNGYRAAAIQPWKPETAYDAFIPPGEGPGGLADPVRFAITAAGTVWINGGEAASSGKTKPDFAKALGEVVEEEVAEISEGGITWKAQAAATVPPTGAAHAVAEIWTPV